MFRGRHTISLDIKGRLAIPAKQRERLVALCHNQLVLTVSAFDPCLWLYPMNEWDVIGGKLQALPDSHPASRRTKQLLLGNATDCEVDGQGRILIPKKLQGFASLNKEVDFCGLGNKFEIWDAAGWSEQESNVPGEIADALKDPDGPLANLTL